jgi:membrane protein DedA with SNARE-associated domain
MAVFFTPAIISGTAKMKRSQFAVWNLIASLAFTFSVAATAYGTGRVSTGHHSTTDIIILIAGLVVGALLIAAFVHRHRRDKAHSAEPPSASYV